MDDPRAFIEANTAVASPPILPEIRLSLATRVTPLWHATEHALARSGLEPPFWAFAWAGGQAIARAVLDAPEMVRGLRVLDLASGSGLCAIAAAIAGAARVIAVDRDPVAAVAIAVNAERNGVRVEVCLDDVIAAPPAWIGDLDVVLAGDVCYDAAMAARIVPWLRARAAAGARVILGDPGRAYLPQEGIAEIARHRVPIVDDVEAEAERVGVVYSVSP